MSLRIRTLLPLIVCALALMAVAFAGLDARDALLRRQRSEAFLEVNQISHLLLRSAAQWATERGTSNAALKAPDAASAARLAAIAQLRSGADEAFREALTQLRAVPQMPSAAITAAEQAFATLQAMRGRIDEAIAKPASARSPDVVQGAFATLTGAIDGAATRLRQTLETVTIPPSAALAQLVTLRHLAAQMSENAGRERGYLGGLINARGKLGGEALRNLSLFRGHIDLAWNMVAAQKQRGDVPAGIVEAIAAVEQDYYRVYNATRDAIFAAGERGDYAISGDEYFKRATVAVDAVLRLADAIGAAADAEAASDAARSNSAAAAQRRPTRPRRWRWCWCFSPVSLRSSAAARAACGWGSTPWWRGSFTPRRCRSGSSARGCSPTPRSRAASSGAPDETAAGADVGRAGLRRHPGDRRRAMAGGARDLARTRARQSAGFLRDFAEPRD